MQFQNIPQPDKYAHLLINASRQFSDEIAFIIAASSIAKIPSPELSLAVLLVSVVLSH